MDLITKDDLRFGHRVMEDVVQLNWNPDQWVKVSTVRVPEFATLHGVMPYETRVFPCTGEGAITSHRTMELHTYGYHDAATRGHLGTVEFIKMFLTPDFNTRFWLIRSFVWKIEHVQYCLYCKHAKHVEVDYLGPEPF